MHISIEQIVQQMNLTWRVTRKVKERLFVIAAAAGITLSSAISQAEVQPPPLPPGSAQVRIEGGLNPKEAARQLRAHHHKFHHKKDMTRDDTVHGDPSHGGTSPVELGYSLPRLVEQTPLAASKTPARIQPANPASSPKTPSRSKP